MSTNSENMTPAQTEELVEYLATQNRVLVVSDFDGTLAAFTEDPTASELNHFAKVALRQLSKLPNTTVAVLSGRALSELARKFSELSNIRLIGSHGHEFDLGNISPLTNEQRELLRQAECVLLEAVSSYSGTRVESKPHGVVFHYRGAPQMLPEDVEAIRQQLRALKGAIVSDGSKIVELRIVETNKGDALLQLKQQAQSAVTLFIGDDITDESAFKVMGESDVAIKVGQGETGAKFRLEAVDQVVQFLARVAERRAEWLSSYPSALINHHLFISDLRTMALIDNTGAVSWFCVPRGDGAPLFGSLVGGPAGGHFRISGPGRVKQQYFEDSLIGKSVYDGVTVTDFFNVSDGRPFQRAGRSDLVRLVEGTGEISVEFAPRLSFGRISTRLYPIADGLRIECGQQRLVLLSPGCSWTISREGEHEVARLRRMLNNESLAFVLLLGTSANTKESVPASQMLAQTRLFWESWVGTLELGEKDPSLLKRSAMVLRGLCYGPSGAIFAAATTSLPETMGGIRNWDYRYCWPRDACLAASALLKLGSIDVAYRLLEWLLEITIDEEAEEFLLPLYTVVGRHAPVEAEVPEATGYQGSTPVRIGNLAIDQLQLDALGPIAELMWEMAKRGAALSADHLSLAERLVAMVESRWMDADSGIWEVRGSQRHYVHSKIMCWYTVECAAKVSSYLGVEHHGWQELADKIRQQVETRGFDETSQSYIAAYDYPQPDAALAWIVLSGFHPPDHPRCVSTLRYIMNNLIRDGNVYRYHFDDSLYGEEGEFTICRCWIIEALAKIGDVESAKKLYDELLTRLGPLSLLSEQWDGKKGIALGNFPQAYSHLGAINAACSLRAPAVKNEI